MSVRRPGLAAAVLAAALVAAARPAGAHQTAIKYVELVATSDGAGLDVTMRAQPVDLSDAVRPGADDREVDVAEAVAAAAAIGPYVQPWLQIRVGDAPCPAGPLTVTASSQDPRYLDLRWRVTCPTPALDAFTLDLGGFFAVDGKHQAVVRLRAAGADDYETIVTASTPALALRLTGARPGTAWAWIHIGTEHILGGLDHLAFVLALLLVIGLHRPGADISVRAPRATMRATALLVSSFTIAHSCTLILAALGVVSLPSAPVELAIAASIVYTAVENLLAPTARWRLALTFGFGLVHGLGFAGALAALLPADHVVTPLLLFNVGVELGQLLVVAVVLPVLVVASRRLGVAGYRRWVVAPLSLLLALAGLLWMVERLGGPAIL